MYIITIIYSNESSKNHAKIQLLVFSTAYRSKVIINKVSLDDLNKKTYICIFLKNKIMAKTKDYIVSFSDRPKVMVSAIDRNQAIDKAIIKAKQASDVGKTIAWRKSKVVSAIQEK